MPLSRKVFEANKRGLFAVAVGEGNISSDFALKFQNARNFLNGEVGKRRGQTRLNVIPFPNNPTLLTVALYEGDYAADYEILAYGGTELRRFTPETREFDVLIKSGLTNNVKLCPASFNGKLIFSNGVDPQFKYGYLPIPGAPTTGTAVSGALGARTYSVRITYYSANGETLAGAATSQAVAANSVLTVTKPTALTGATHYGIYLTAGAAGGERLIDKVAIGSNWQEPNAGAVGTDLPPQVNRAWYTANLGGSPPLAKYIYTVNHRLWMAGIPNRETRLIGCAPDNEDDWSTPNSYFEVDLTSVISRGDKIRGLSRVGQTNELVIGMRSHIVIYAVPVTVANIVLSQVIYNIGVLSHYSMTEIGSDTYIVGQDGVTSLRRDLLMQALNPKPVTKNIKDGFNDDVTAMSDAERQETVSIYYPKENEYFVSMPARAKIWNYDYLLQSWREDPNKTIRHFAATPDGFLLSCGAGGLVHREYKNAAGGDVYGDDNNNTDVSFRWDTPWLWLDDVSRKKILKYFQFKGTGEGQFDMDVYLDFASEPYKTIYLQSFASLFDQAYFDTSYWDFPDINKVLIPLVGRGKAVKFSFRANHQKRMTISFYGVQYALAGLRGND